MDAIFSLVQQIMDLIYQLLCCSKKSVKVDHSKKEKSFASNLKSGTMQYEKSGHPDEELATFGAGCYWGTEKYYAINFQKVHPNSLFGYAVGFMSPNSDAPENPKYKEVKMGDTTHVEVLHIKFDSSKVSYEELVRFFYTFHDPTTENK